MEVGEGLPILGHSKRHDHLPRLDLLSRHYLHVGFSRRRSVSSKYHYIKHRPSIFLNSLRNTIGCLRPCRTKDRRGKSARSSRLLQCDNDLFDIAKHLDGNVNVRFQNQHNKIVHWVGKGLGCLQGSMAHYLHIPVLGLHPRSTLRNNKSPGSAAASHLRKLCDLRNNSDSYLLPVNIQNEQAQ